MHLTGNIEDDAKSTRAHAKRVEKQKTISVVDIYSIWPQINLTTRGDEKSKKKKRKRFREKKNRVSLPLFLEIFISNKLKLKYEEASHGESPKMLSAV